MISALCATRGGWKRSKRPRLLRLWNQTLLRQQSFASTKGRRDSPKRTLYPILYAFRLSKGTDLIRDLIGRKPIEISASNHLLLLASSTCILILCWECNLFGTGRKTPGGYWLIYNRYHTNHTVLKLRDLIPGGQLVASGVPVSCIPIYTYLCGHSRRSFYVFAFQRLLIAVTGTAFPKRTKDVNEIVRLEQSRPIDKVNHSRIKYPVIRRMSITTRRKLNAINRTGLARQEWSLQQQMALAFLIAL